MPLEQYQKKRNFKKTAEPEAIVAQSGERLHYALQKHDARRLHFDLRLEWNGVLLSWAVPKGPSMNPKDKRLAVQVEDHPLDYREFEGTIPAGEYGGGTVQLFDEGLWHPITDVEKGLEKGELKFLLAGQRFKGQFVLVRIKPKPGETDKNWLLIKEKDNWVSTQTGLEGFETSISSGRTLDEIAESKVARQKPSVHPQEWLEAHAKELSKPLPFTTAEVMLAKLQNQAPKGEGWRHEIKFDGYQLLAFVEDGKVVLRTRSGLDWSAKFPAIRDALQNWDAPANMVLDGEVVVMDAQGRSNFQALQQAIKGEKDAPLRYMVFDLLACGSEDLRKLPLEERQALLAALLLEPPANLHLSPWTEGDPQALFGKLCDLQQEGLISKRMGSAYYSGRGSDWVKSKCKQRQEFIVVAYTQSEKRRAGLSSLLLAVNTDAGLKYAGRTGTGFSNQESLDLVKYFKSLVIKDHAVSIPREFRPPEEITWLKPEVVVEVEYAEMTDDGIVRQAAYKGLREDKPAAEIVAELPSEAELSGSTSEQEDDKAKARAAASKPTTKARGRKGTGMKISGISISSPEKIVDPKSETTKAQVAEYYETIASRLLPYLAKRLVSLVRYPDGVMEEGFYMKHASGQIKGVKEKTITESDGDKAPYVYIEDLKGIMGAVQMSTLEFHPWGSKVNQLEKPDMLTFDLDPDAGLNLEQVRQGVLHLKSVVDGLGLQSFLKTSGGKGYHIVVPLIPNAGWEKARDFAEKLAHLMEQQWPKLYTANMRKEKRKGRIYVDWVRNSRGATSVCAYSLRARESLPISWPIDWKDLEHVTPNQVTLANFTEYSKADPWKGFFDTANELQV